MKSIKQLSITFLLTISLFSMKTFGQESRPQTVIADGLYSTVDATGKGKHGGTEVTIAKADLKIEIVRNQKGAEVYFLGSDSQMRELPQGWGMITFHFSDNSMQHAEIANIPGQEKTTIEMPNADKAESAFIKMGFDSFGLAIPINFKEQK